MRPKNTFRFFAVLGSAVALMTAACAGETTTNIGGSSTTSSASSGSGGNGSGGMGTGGIVNPGDDCDEICAAGATDCPGWDEEDKNGCKEGCGSASTNLPPECKAAWDALVACAKKPGTWNCEDGSPANCHMEMGAFEMCTGHGQDPPTAGLGPYCDKCAKCHVDDPMFSEGFCDDFWDGKTFDLETCKKDGNPGQINNKDLTADQIDKMTCTEFDNEI